MYSNPVERSYVETPMCKMPRQNIHQKSEEVYKRFVEKFPWGWIFQILKSTSQKHVGTRSKRYNVMFSNLVERSYVENPMCKMPRQNIHPKSDEVRKRVVEKFPWMWNF